MRAMHRIPSPLDGRTDGRTRISPSSSRLLPRATDLSSLPPSLPFFCASFGSKGPPAPRSREGGEEERGGHLSSLARPLRGATAIAATQLKINPRHSLPPSSAHSRLTFLKLRTRAPGAGGRSSSLLLADTYSPKTAGGSLSHCVEEERRGGLYPPFLPRNTLFSDGQAFTKWTLHVHTSISCSKILRKRQAALVGGRKEGENVGKG